MDKALENALPNGWVECSVGDITLPVEKIDLKGKPDKEIDYVDISSIDNNCNKIGETKRFCLRDAPSRARQIVHAGDVLFSTVRPYLRNIAFVPSQLDKQIASTGFSVLRPATGFEPELLFYKVISSEFVNTLSGKQYGVSYPAVKDEQVRAQILALPPASEQHRIVAKIEELFSELDKGIESLKTAREQHKVYRQALLKHAFEGKLTEQWRKDNEDDVQGSTSAAGAGRAGTAKLETADQLLARIQRERTNYLDDMLESGDNEARRFINKIKKNVTNYPGYALPASARWVNFLEICSFIVDCHNKTAPYQDDGIYLIRTPCIRNGKIYLNHEARFVSDETFSYWSRRCPPQPGDIIFTREAPMGEVCIVPGSVKLCMGQRMMLLRPPASMNSKYLLYSMMEPQFRSRMTKDSVGTGVKHLRVGDVERLCIPLFSLEEQIEIVARLDSTLSIVDENLIEIDANLKRTKALRQSILKKAFSGKLVPQDPNDEPASELLKRIAAEKAEIAKQIKTTKQTTRKTKSQL